jgi:hypothetical protein
MEALKSKFLKPKFRLKQGAVETVENNRTPGRQIIATAETKRGIC